MQGTELAAAMRRIRPELPVVIMSGYFSKISPQALDELGPIELLAKPFTTDELAHAVYRALHPSAKALG
jgi:DNA-binding NtrC family response regulator